MTSISLSAAATVQADAVVVGVYAAETAEGAKAPALAPGAEAVDAGYGGSLAKALEAVGATGKEGELSKVPGQGDVAAPLVVAVGLGKAPESGGAPEAGALRRAAAVAARSLTGKARAVFALPAADAAQVGAVAEGALLGAYAYEGVKTPSKDRKGPVGEIVLVTAAAGQDAAEKALSRSADVAASVNVARDMVNTPPSHLYPQTFAEHVQAAVEAASVDALTVEVLDEHALAAGGYGGILGIGKGSTKAPRLVRLAYRPAGAAKHLALVGKGITFDTGGISLKPSNAMETMKSDMSGAAAVFAATVAIARQGVPVDVTAYMSLAENMPGGGAIKVSDVITMYGGKTVEVMNTDAEGRIVMADALVRASQDAPDVLLDVATLTGAQVLALDRLSAVMGNDDALRVEDRRDGRRGRRGDVADAAAGVPARDHRHPDRRPVEHGLADGRHARGRAVPARVRRRGREVGPPGHRRRVVQREGPLRRDAQGRHRRRGADAGEARRGAGRVGVADPRDTPGRQEWPPPPRGRPLRCSPVGSGVLRCLPWAHRGQRGACPPPPTARPTPPARRTARTARTKSAGTKTARRSADPPAHPQHDPHAGLGSRLNRLRAGVLGANDGIVSTAGLVVGVAGATSSRDTLLASGIAGLLAGSLSMASGEYVSVSTQRDTEKAALELEQRELKETPEAELAELAGLYRDMGLSDGLAQQVAEELTAHDALAAHAGAELGIDPEELVRPWDAALASFVSFSLGALLPLLTIVLPPEGWRVPATVVSVLIALVATGWVSARLGRAAPLRAVARNVAGRRDRHGHHVPRRHVHRIATG